MAVGSDHLAPPRSQLFGHGNIEGVEKCGCGELIFGSPSLYGRFSDLFPEHPSVTHVETLKGLLLKITRVNLGQNFLVYVFQRHDISELIFQISVKFPLNFR